MIETPLLDRTDLLGHAPDSYELALPSEGEVYWLKIERFTCFIEVLGRSFPAYEPDVVQFFQWMPYEIRDNFLGFNHDAFRWILVPGAGRTFVLRRIPHEDIPRRHWMLFARKRRVVPVRSLAHANLEAAKSAGYEFTHKTHTRPQ